MPAIQETQETQFRSLGQEDPLEKGMATRSNIFAWEIPRTEEPGGLQSMAAEVIFSLCISVLFSDMPGNHQI